MHTPVKASAEKRASRSAAERSRPAKPIAQRVARAHTLPAPARLTQLAAVVNPTGLPANLQAGVERLSGRSLADVRVHRNSAQPAQLNAHAFAQGRDIHLAPGQEKHLPHEAWHVVQQAQGRVQPTMQLQDRGVPVNDDHGLEREADVMGARAAALPSPTPEARLGVMQQKARTRLARVRQRQATGAPVAAAPLAASAFVVEDTAAPGPGQITRTAFLADLHAHLAAIADTILVPFGQTSQDCPYLQFWFSYYHNRNATQMEESIRRFAPETAQAAGWQAWITLIGERVRKSFSSFVRSGTIGPIPPEVPKDLAEKEAKHAPVPPAHAGAAPGPVAQRVTAGPAVAQLCMCCCCNCCRPTRTSATTIIATPAHARTLTARGHIVVPTAVEMDRTGPLLENRRLAQYEEPDPARHYYTATSAASVASIGRTGLDPNFGGSGTGSVSTARNVGAYNSRGHIYFFSTLRGAQTYGKNNSGGKEDRNTEKDKNDYAICTFTLPAGLVFTPDPESGVGGRGSTAFRTDQRIPATNIVGFDVVNRMRRNAPSSAAAVDDDVQIDVADTGRDEGKRDFEPAPSSAAATSTATAETMSSAPLPIASPAALELQPPPLPLLPLPLLAINSAASSSTVQLARNNYGGNPGGRGGKGKKFIAHPPGKRGPGRNFDSGSSAAAHRQQQGKHERFVARRATVQVPPAQADPPGLSAAVRRDLLAAGRTPEAIAQAEAVLPPALLTTTARVLALLDHLAAGGSAVDAQRAAVHAPGDAALLAAALDTLREFSAVPAMAGLAQDKVTALLHERSHLGTPTLRTYAVAIAAAAADGPAATVALLAHRPFGYRADFKVRADTRGAAARAALVAGRQIAVSAQAAHDRQQADLDQNDDAFLLLSSNQRSALGGSAAQALIQPPPFLTSKHYNEGRHLLTSHRATAAQPEIDRITAKEQADLHHAASVEGPAEEAHVRGIHQAYFSGTNFHPDALAALDVTQENHAQATAVVAALVAAPNTRPLWLGGLPVAKITRLLTVPALTLGALITTGVTTAAIGDYAASPAGLALLTALDAAAVAYGRIDSLAPLLAGLAVYVNDGTSRGHLVTLLANDNPAAIALMLNAAPDPPLNRAALLVAVRPRAASAADLTHILTVCAGFGWPQADITVCLTAQPLGSALAVQLAAVHAAHLVRFDKFTNFPGWLRAVGELITAGYVTIHALGGWQRLPGGMVTDERNYEVALVIGGAQQDTFCVHYHPGAAAAAVGSAHASPSHFKPQRGGIIRNGYNESPASICGLTERRPPH